MKPTQWFIFSGGFFILSLMLNNISVSKNMIATTMIGIDSMAFVAWKIISGMFFLFFNISIALSLIFLICGYLKLID